MGIMNFINSKILPATQKMQDSMVQINKYKEEYEKYDDERLIKMIKSYCSPEQRAACRMILQERGVL